MSNAGLALGILTNLAIVATVFGLLGAAAHYGLGAALAAARNIIRRREASWGSR